MFKRHQNAQVAGRRIDRSDERDDRNNGEYIYIRKCDAGAGHQDGAGEQQIA